MKELSNRTYQEMRPTPALISLLCLAFVLLCLALAMALTTGCNYKSDNTVSPTDPVIEEPLPGEAACMLPSEIQASLTPDLPAACRGNSCVANRSIDATSPPFVAATWTTPGAVQTEHSGINGTISYPFTLIVVTHEWSVLACTDDARLCCRSTNGTVTFNG